MAGIEQIPWLYDPLCALAETLGLGRWRRWLVEGASGRTLDLGCGTGRSLALGARGRRVVGLDPAVRSLRVARRRAPGVPLVAARAEALPFRDGAFDTVMSALVFCSVADASGGLAEVRRVLAAGGSLRMLEHVRSPARWKARVQDLVQPLWTRVTGGCHPNRDTEAAVAAAGFDVDVATRRARRDMRRFAARPIGG
jgi:ubiquinone/menaquinone biosynthesis C-methylase UbiE